jgi:transmembrane sensor
MVLVVASLVWWVHDGELLGMPKRYATAHGQQGVWRLPDGSLIHLNTDGDVTVHYSRAERTVDVNRGQAFFQVVGDSKRRFRVTAGDVQVVAVGTEFDVYRRPYSTLVTVVDGTVAVSTGDSTPRLGYSGPAPQTLHVRAGRQVGIQSGTMWAEPMPVDLNAATAWLHHQIVVQDQPLGDVAEEFNRYTQVHVEIDDPTARALRVNGRFDAYDTDSLARFLESLDGVTVQRTATRIRVVRLSPEKKEPPPAGR